MKHIIAVLFCASVLSNAALAQCFSSTGNPIGGNANMGVMKKGMFRLGSFYKHAYSGKYFKGNELSVDDGHITAEYAVYNYISMLLSYGVTDNLTLETSTGYFLNKTKAFATPVTGYGLTNTVVSAKYAFYHNPASRVEITGGLGAKIPMRNEEQRMETSTITIANHPDVQSCLGNYGAIAELYIIKEKPFTGLRYFLTTKYEHNFNTLDGYFDLRQFNFGNSLNTSVFITKHIHMPPALSWLTENWTAIAQIRHEHKWQNQIRTQDYQGQGQLEYNDWHKVKNSGSDVIFFCPQINYTFFQKLNISVLADIPLYQYYKGIQLASDYAFAVNLTWDLDLSGREKGIDEEQ
ncbi:MAG: hypothetical protein ACLFM1_08865 [Bacteroidales bacterium]